LIVLAAAGTTNGEPFGYLRVGLLRRSLRKASGIGLLTSPNDRLQLEPTVTEM